MPPAFVYLDLGNVVVLFDRGRAFAAMAAVSGAGAALVEDLGDGEVLPRARRRRGVAGVEERRPALDREDDVAR